MVLEVPHYSRYIDTEEVNFRGVNTFGLYTIPDVIKNIQSEDLERINIDVSLAGRPDMISYERYGTPYYAWVIVMINQPINTIGWPKAGTSILVPTNSKITEIIHER